MMVYSIIVLTIEMIVLKIQTKLPTFGYKGKDLQEYNYQCTSEESRLYSNVTIHFRGEIYLTRKFVLFVLKK